MSFQSKRNHNNNNAMMELSAYLNSLPTDVISIDVSRFKVKQMPDLSRFTRVRELHCQFNRNLEHIVSLPKTLKILYLNLNQILSSLPPLPDLLEELYCRGCSLTSLPTLPKTLKVLDCSNNIEMSSLPILPDTLGRLWCHDNALMSLPKLPTELVLLQCSNNDLESLPNLPDKLELLRCNDNHLMALPNLPPSLKSLDCSKNRLTNLPPLDNHIQVFCRNNPIHERIGRITDVSNASNDKYTFTDIIKYKKLMRFQEMFYNIKYKRKFQQWVLRSKETEIMAKYKPENLFRILEKMGDKNFQDTLDIW